MSTPPAYLPTYAVFRQGSGGTWDLISTHGHDRQGANTAGQEAAAARPHFKVWVVELVAEAEVRFRDHVADRAKYAGGRK